MTDLLKMLRRPVAAVIRALADVRGSGVLELQLATNTGLSVERVHETVNELAQLGAVVHEDSPSGYLVRLNPRSPWLGALRLSPHQPATRRSGADLVERLRTPGADLNVAYLWEGPPGRLPLVIATVDDKRSDEELELVKARLFRVLEPVLPAEPLVRVFRWIEYLAAFADGDEELIEVWQGGTQLAGRDPLCDEAVVRALRWAVDSSGLRSRVAGG